jgi:deoxyhypusine synthase
MHNTIKLHKPIKHAKITANMSIDSFIKELDGCAFGAGRLANAVDIYYEMLSTNTTKFFGLSGAMIPAGMRSIVADLIYDGHIDTLVTTSANMVHDMIEGLSLNHYKGNENAHDIELKEKQINRIYDVFLPESHFTDFEDKMQSIFNDLSNETISIRELFTHIGKNIDDKDSILKAAFEMEVPIYCPAVQDSIIGLQAWLYKQINPLNVDVFADMKEFMDICYNAEKSGAMLVGGGVPKNYIFQSMLVTPKEFDYAIQLTTATPHDGGLSGATLDEARSWGKVGKTAKSATVYADATITLPLIVAATKTRLENNSFVSSE